jgi:hypothetical protein
MHEFKVGDRVAGSGTFDGRDIDGKLGTVKHLFRTGDLGIEFDDNIGGHDGFFAWNGKPGHCWNVPSTQLKPEHYRKSIIIHTDGKTTTAILKEGKTVLKRATAKCSPGDKFDFTMGAMLAFDRLMAEDKPAPAYYNGKVICIKAGVFHTVGKIYTVKNGLLDDDTGGEPYNASNPVCGLQELNACWMCKFIEYKGGLE